MTSDSLDAQTARLSQLLAGGDFTAAEILLTDLAQSHPQEFAIWNNLGAVRDKLDLPEQAVEAYRRATALKPNHAAGHYNLALALKRCGRLGDALAAYDRALTNDPQNAAIHINLGAALVEAGRTGQAFPILQRAVELAQDSSIAWFNLDIAARHVRQPSMAATCFERVLGWEPDHLEAIHELGESYLSSGRHEQALEQFTRALDMRIAAGGLEDRRESGPATRLDSDRARAALFAVSDALEEAGVTFVLTGGTALGCAREGDFIGHDNDIDLAVLPGTPSDAIERAFDSAQALRVEAVEYQNDDLLRVIVNHEQRVRTDVFLYHVAEGGWWFGIARGKEALCWLDSPFETKEIEFHNRRFLLPHPVERYLVENYGADWRIPNPYHVAGFTAGNVRNDYFSFPRAIGYALIGRSIRDSKLKQALYYCSVAAARDPSDVLMQRAMTVLNASLA